MKIFAFLIILLIAVACCPIEIDLPNCENGFEANADNDGCICKGIESRPDLCLAPSDSLFRFVRGEGFLDCWEGIEALFIEESIAQPTKIEFSLYYTSRSPSRYAITRDTFNRLRAHSMGDTFYPVWFDCEPEEHVLDRLAVQHEFTIGADELVWVIDFFDATDSIDLGVSTALYFTKVF